MVYLHTTSKPSGTPLVTGTKENLRTHVYNLIMEMVLEETEYPSKLGISCKTTWITFLQTLEPMAILIL